MNRESLIHCQIDKGVMVEVITYGGKPTVKALDKLIEILVLTRNNWAEEQRERRLQPSTPSELVDHKEQDCVPLAAMVEVIHLLQAAGAATHDDRRIRQALDTAILSISTGGQPNAQ